METLPGYDAWKLSGPPEPSEYVVCRKCRHWERRDDAVYIESRDWYLCAKCGLCESCGEEPAVRLCGLCDSLTCAACYREYDYGIDPETGYHDAGEQCGKCAREAADSVSEPPPSADGGGECPW